MTALKVFGWDGARVEAAQLARTTQTREIVAAPTAAAARRIAGVTEHFWRTYAERTDNELEVDVATSEPGVVFWIPEAHQHRAASADEWHRSPAT